MRAARIASACVSVFALCAALAPAGGASTEIPRWLAGAQNDALHGIFGNAEVIHTYHIWYPSKVAVVFEFTKVEACRTCTGPSPATSPRGRFVRITFNRKTHKIEPGLQFCDVHDSDPPKSVCLRH